MQFFIDSANIEEIQKAHTWGLIDGVTTNPSLIAKEGKNLETVIPEIMAIVDGPISIEVLAKTQETMVTEAMKYAEFGPNAVIKLPMTLDGLAAVRTLSSQGIKTNVTLCFTPTQALLAAKSGATYISPFVGRLDDISTVGMALIEQILTIYTNYGFVTEVLVASVRNPIHVAKAALSGAHVATIPFKVITQLANHPLTDIGIQRFEDDWKKLSRQ